jgi:predicted DNA-binding ribbon-helix-helix protein
MVEVGVLAASAAAASGRKDHRHLAANQIVGHVSKPVVIAAMFESNVLAHNVAGFLEALPECINYVQEALPASRPAGGRNMHHTDRGVVMKSLVARRCVVVADHKTSVSVEGAFWNGLKEIARGRNITLSELVEAIDSERRHGNLSSAIRLFVLDFYRNQRADVQSGPDGAKGNLAIKPESVVQS